jgi:hypothetical protein
MNKSAVTRWNTYSPSWTIRNKVTEVNAYAFLPADNYVYFICVDGNIYYYNGGTLQLQYNIRNPKTTFGHQLTTNLQGKPLVANGGTIYSLYKKNPSMPLALVGEYTCSQGETATIYSILANGSNLQVSWGITVNSVTTYGVDEISSNYATAQIITPHFGKYSNVKVYYDNLNTGSISIEHRLDDSDTWVSHTVINDSDDFHFIRTVEDMQIPSGAQARVTVIPVSGKSSPIIDNITIS